VRDPWADNARQRLGRFPQVETKCVDMRDVADARAAVSGHASLIARGNGRSYGDAALNPSCVLSTRRSDRILAFDAASGRITVEAGLLLADLSPSPCRAGTSRRSCREPSSSPSAA